MLLLLSIFLIKTLYNSSTALSYLDFGVNVNFKVLFFSELKFISTTVGPSTLPYTVWALDQTPVTLDNLSFTFGFSNSISSSNICWLSAFKSPTTSSRFLILYSNSAIPSLSLSGMLKHPKKNKGNK